VDGKVDQHTRGVESVSLRRWWRQSAPYLLLARVYARVKRIARFVKSVLFFALLAIWAAFLVFISSDEWQ